MSIAAELYFNDFGGPYDQGLAALLAPPTAGVLPSLECINLSDNQIADEGCAALAPSCRHRSRAPRAAPPRAPPPAQARR